MSRRSVLLSALTNEPVSTSELYSRIGYVALTDIGLVPYHTFRAELAKLSASGLLDSETAADGSTTWRRTGEHASGEAG
jgi:hypothetical protein